MNKLHSARAVRERAHALVTFDVKHYAAEIDRRVALMEMLRTHPEGQGIVYADSARDADMLFHFIAALREPVAAVHARVPMRERETNLARFDRGIVRVLVTTPRFLAPLGGPVAFRVHYATAASALPMRRVTPR